jgi:hypothetical protein
MTEKQKQYVMDNWKLKTATVIAKELTTADNIVRTSDVHAYLTRNDITPITKRDLISGKLVELYNNGIIQVAALSRELKVSQQLVKDITDELGLNIQKNRKRGPIAKDDLSEMDDLSKSMMKQLKEREARIKEIRSNRASYTVYNQTGSPILDDLRNIKTTKRESTLLSNTDKKNST